jgi:hypothetical protein
MTSFEKINLENYKYEYNMKKKILIIQLDSFIVRKREKEKKKAQN